MHYQYKHNPLFNSGAFFIFWITPLASTRIWIRLSAFLLPWRSVRPSLSLLSLLTGFCGHILELLGCFASRFLCNSLIWQKRCKPKGKVWGRLKWKWKQKGSRSVLCHCLHSVWIISSCSRFCLIQEGFCLTNAHYCVRLWLQSAKGHSVWPESFAKNCTWEHAVPSGCYENSPSTKCRSLPEKSCLQQSRCTHVLPNLQNSAKVWPKGFDSNVLVLNKQTDRA